MREISLTEPLSKTRPTSLLKLWARKRRRLGQLYVTKSSMLLFMALPVLVRQQPQGWC